MNRRKLNQRNSFGLWERWVLQSAIAQIIGLTIVGIASAVVNRMGYIQGIFTFIGILEGTVLGFTQWLVLRRYIRHSTQWIFATIIGGLLAWFTGLTISVLMAFTFAGASGNYVNITFIKGLILLGMGIGGVLGFCQWLAIRTQIRYGVWWIFANAIAWSLGLLVAYFGAGAIEEKLGIQTALTTVATGGVMGVVIGSITGIALIWLLKPRLKKS
ncbi:hypothetical protein [Brunnivagina elsteri]|uniref:Uncharacterized protein n=1 Tax=Brunnivagina elsteri CCALA 953 TaxID=987040 RepID=A0A2A2TLN6_9CYAN|nr:hypothetical protein [Calothrix elsteri]PAX58329.1 hypothetical protein CK510_08085 [Calothrix elsteri CCALA 953]